MAEVSKRPKLSHSTIKNEFIHDAFKEALTQGERHISDYYWRTLVAPDGVHFEWPCKSDTNEAVSLHKSLEGSTPTSPSEADVAFGNPAMLYISDWHPSPSLDQRKGLEQAITWLCSRDQLTQAEIEERIARRKLIIDAQNRAYEDELVARAQALADAEEAAKVAAAKAAKDKADRMATRIHIAFMRRTDPTYGRRKVNRLANGVFIMSKWKNSGNEYWAAVISDHRKAGAKDNRFKEDAYKARCVDGNTKWIPRSWFKTRDDDADRNMRLGEFALPGRSDEFLNRPPNLNQDQIDLALSDSDTFFELRAREQVFALYPLMSLVVGDQYEPAQHEVDNFFNDLQTRKTPTIDHKYGDIEPHDIDRITDQILTWSGTDDARNSFSPRFRKLRHQDHAIFFSAIMLKIVIANIQAFKHARELIYLDDDSDSDLSELDPSDGVDVIHMESDSSDKLRQEHNPESSYIIESDTAQRRQKSPVGDDNVDGSEVVDVVEIFRKKDVDQAQDFSSNLPHPPTQPASEDNQESSFNTYQSVKKKIDNSFNNSESVSPKSTENAHGEDKLPLIVEGSLPVVAESQAKLNRQVIVETAGERYRRGCELLKSKLPSWGGFTEIRLIFQNKVQALKDQTQDSHRTKTAINKTKKLATKAIKKNGRRAQPLVRKALLNTTAKATALRNSATKSKLEHS